MECHRQKVRLAYSKASVCDATADQREYASVSASAEGSEGGLRQGSSNDCHAMCDSICDLPERPPRGTRAPQETRNIGPTTGVYERDEVVVRTRCQNDKIDSGSSVKQRSGLRVGQLFECRPMSTKVGHTQGRDRQHFVESGPNLAGAERKAADVGRRRADFAAISTDVGLDGPRDDQCWENIGRTRAELAQTW